MCVYLARVDIPFVREHYFVHSSVWTFAGTCLVMHVVMLRVCINQHLEGDLAALFGTPGSPSGSTVPSLEGGVNVHPSPLFER